MEAPGHPVPFQVEDDGGDRLHFSGADVVIRASAETTGGAFSVMEEIDPLDTPLHVHAHEDEIFYALEGEHVVQVGDREYAMRPGDLVFGPRGVPHAQRRAGPRRGRLLNMFSPAGIEGFFRELAAAETSGTLGAEAYERASSAYGIGWR